MGFLIYEQKGSFFLFRGTGIKFRVPPSSLDGVCNALANRKKPKASGLNPEPANPQASTLTLNLKL